MPMMEPAYKRKMRIDQKEASGEPLTDFEIAERERLMQQILAENQAADAETAAMQGAAPAKSTQELRNKYLEMARQQREQNGVPYNLEAAAALQRGAMQPGYNPEAWAQNAAEASDELKKGFASIRKAFR